MHPRPHSIFGNLQRLASGVYTQRATPAVLIAALLLTLYILTMSEHTTLEDSGAFISWASVAGIPHPSGYPLYSMLGALFAQIPIDDIAFRVKLFSAIAVAMTSVCIYFSCLLLNPRRSIASVCALFFGLCGLPWANAIVAEVYALHGLFYALLLYLALRLHRDFNQRDLYLWTLVLGLSLSHHWPLTILGGLSFAPLLLGDKPVQRIRHIWRHAIPLAGLLLVGLLPYLYLIIRSFFPLPLAFSGAVTAGDFIDYVLRSQYSAIDVSPTATSADGGQMFQYFLQQFSLDTGVIGTVAVALGALALLLARRWALTISLFLGFIASPVILLMFLNFDYDLLRREAYMTYQVMPYIVSALYLHWGLCHLLERSKPMAKKWQHLPAIFASVLICTSAFAVNFSENNMRSNNLAYDYASTVLRLLPENATLFLLADTEVGPVSYARYVAKVRPDVRLYSAYGHMFENPLFNPVQQSLQQAAEVFAEYLATEKRVFATSTGMPVQLPPNAKVYNHGLLQEISLSDKSSEFPEISNLATSFLDRYRHDPHARLWEQHRQTIVSRFCLTLLLNGKTHPVIEESPYCRYLNGQHLAIQNQNERARDIFKALIDQGALISKGQRAELYAKYTDVSVKLINKNKGEKAEKLQQWQQLVDEIRHALEILPTCSNPVANYLFQIHDQAGVDIGYEQLKQSYSVCDNFKPLFRRIDAKTR